MIGGVPYISVIILNWNGKDLLKCCLDSVLLANYPKESFEVLVVDNGSSDGSVSFVNDMYQSIKTIKNDLNLGFCEGNNAGLRIASGDILILLNNDTMVDSDFFVGIVKEFENPNVGIVGCKILNPGTNILQNSGFLREFPGLWQSIGDGEALTDNFHTSSNIDYVQGAALAIRKQTAENIGLLNPRYETVEDAEWCYRAREAGYEVAMSNAVVYHFNSLSWKRFPSVKRFMAQNKARHRLIQKYCPPKNLLTYVFGFPAKCLQSGVLRYVKGVTSVQNIASSENVQKWRVFISAVGKFALEWITFSVALFLVMGERQR